jgi:hypothetical protein
LIDPFKCDYYTAKERELAIKNANTAFDILGLPKNAPERQVLKPPVKKAVVAQTPLMSHSDSSPDKEKLSVPKSAEIAKTESVKKIAKSPLKIGPSIEMETTHSSSSSGSESRKRRQSELPIDTNSKKTRLKSVQDKKKSLDIPTTFRNHSLDLSNNESKSDSSPDKEYKPRAKEFEKSGSNPKNAGSPLISVFGADGENSRKDSPDNRKRSSSSIQADTNVKKLKSNVQEPQSAGAGSNFSLKMKMSDAKPNITNLKESEVVGRAIRKNVVKAVSAKADIDSVTTKPQGEVRIEKASIQSDVKRVNDSTDTEKSKKGIISPQSQDDMRATSQAPTAEAGKNAEAPRIKIKFGKDVLPFSPPKEKACARIPLCN